MSLNTFSYLLNQYQVIAVDDYNQIPHRIYIAPSGNQVTELTKVILIDLDRHEVFAPQMIGSYAKFLCPVRLIDPNLDNIEEILKRIEKLPDLTKINLSRIMEEKPEIADYGYQSFYDLNEYLFKELNKKFKEHGSLDACDFFCIVIWKANRAKSTMARMLLRKFNSLEIASRSITSYLSNENLSDYDRFKYLLGMGFRLPMLSAILTVLYPERFLVYDYRICSNQEMVDFKKLSNGIKDTQSYWHQYQNYIASVIENTPSWMTLRQKDQYLWGKSFALQLKEDIECNFEKPILSDI